MRKSIEIIGEIKSDASDLQRKLTTLPGSSGCTPEQSHTLDLVQDALRSFRDLALPVLENAFKDSGE